MQNQKTKKKTKTLQGGPENEWPRVWHTLYTP